jgi:hypothetical protein
MRNTVSNTLGLAAAERNGEQADDQVDGESRGGMQTSRPRRRGRPVPPVKGKGRKLTISDAVFERLKLAAMRKKPMATMSALANDLLDRTLPHFEVKQQDRPTAE